MDGFGVMDYIRQNKLNCAIIVVSNFSDEKIKLAEELYRQIAFLGYMKDMAAM